MLAYWDLNSIIYVGETQTQFNTYIVSLLAKIVLGTKTTQCVAYYAWQINKQR